MKQEICEQKLKQAILRLKQTTLKPEIWTREILEQKILQQELKQTIQERQIWEQTIWKQKTLKQYRIYRPLYKNMECTFVKTIGPKLLRLEEHTRKTLAEIAEKLKQQANGNMPLFSQEQQDLIDLCLRVNQEAQKGHFPKTEDGTPFFICDNLLIPALGLNDTQIKEVLDLDDTQTGALNVFNCYDQQKKMFKFPIIIKESIEPFAQYMEQANQNNLLLEPLPSELLYLEVGQEPAGVKYIYYSNIKDLCEDVNNSFSKQ